MSCRTTPCAPLSLTSLWSGLGLVGISIPPVACLGTSWLTKFLYSKHFRLMKLLCSKHFRCRSLSRSFDDRIAGSQCDVWVGDLQNHLEGRWRLPQTRPPNLFVRCVEDDHIPDESVQDFWCSEIAVATDAAKIGHPVAISLTRLHFTLIKCVGCS